MIPKKIHYCWFGGNPLPNDFQKYIESWKSYCSDYQIIEWNETNIDLHSCKYLEQAYNEKKWAFVADYVRFLVVFKEGGIYLDTDIEVIKPLDELLENNAFFGFGSTSLTVPIFGAMAGHPCLEDILEDYSHRSFIKEDGTLDETTIERTVSRILTSNYGLKMNWEEQYLRDGIRVYPREYFFSTDWHTGIVHLNPKLYVIHYAVGTWLPEEERIPIEIRKKTIHLFGEKIGQPIGTAIYLLKYKGFSGLLKRIIERNKNNDK